MDRKIYLNIRKCYFNICNKLKKLHWFLVGEYALNINGNNAIMRATMMEACQVTNIVNRTIHRDMNSQHNLSL